MWPFVIAKGAQARRQMLGELGRRNGEGPLPELAEHQVGAWHITVVDRPRNDLGIGAMPRQRANLDLKGDGAAARNAGAQEFEGVRFRHDLELEPLACCDLVEQLPPTDGAQRQSYGVGRAVAL